MSEKEGAGTAADAAAGESAEDSDERGETPDELVARVAAVDERLAADVATLQDRVDELAADLASRDERIEELESRLKRERADFQNYKKRAKEREAEIRERATEDLVERLLDVRDNLVRALSQDDDVDIREGIEATLSSFDRVLEEESVSTIEPEPGESVDPERHEVMMRIDGDQPADRIEEVFRTGYELAGTVLRPAQVSVSDSDEE